MKTTLDALDVNIRYQEDLSKYTTFHLGGSCKALITCHTSEELTMVVNQLIKDKEDYILIGGGSNLLVSDEGVDCYVIRYASDIPLISRDGDEIEVSGSTGFDALTFFAAKHGLEGINTASGIPGTVGGAVVGNAGAFGRQIGDVITSIRLLNKQGQVVDSRPSDLGFSYRHSNLKERNDIVLSVRLRLQKGDAEALSKERDEILTLRASKHPNLDLEPCAGSFFRNVEPTSKAQRRQAAGWFLEQAGAKEISVGGAEIFDKHANIIVAKPGCTAKDVFQLHQLMHKAVKEKFGIDLVREVRLVGRFGVGPSDKSCRIW